jgi:hypothetical protein
MEPNATRIASTLTETTTRRGALRFLAATMSSTSLATLGIASSDAKKRRKNKKKGKKQNAKQTCGRDGRLARISVPHDGAVVYTPELNQGQRYRLRVSDYVVGTGNLLTAVGIDAGYIYRPGGDPNLARDTYGGVDFGLSVDGAPASWGPFASDHIYEREVQGNGQRLALRLISEPETNQAVAQRIIAEEPDLNLTLEGFLTVEVLCS